MEKKKSEESKREKMIAHMKLTRSLMRSSVFYVTSCQVDKLSDRITPDRELSRRNQRLKVYVLHNQSGKRRSYGICKLEPFFYRGRK
jgi:hypothetical protein